MIRQDDVFAGDLLFGIAEEHFDAVFFGKGQLRHGVFARAGVLGFLNDDRLIFGQGLSESEGRGQRNVAGRSALHAFEGGQRFGDVEDFALFHEHVSIHVAQGAGRAALDIAAVGLHGKGNAEAGVAGGKGFAVKVVIGGHVQAGEVDAGGVDLRVFRTGFAHAAGRARQVAAARIGGDHDIGFFAFHLLELADDFRAQRFDTGDGRSRIEGGIVKACLLKEFQGFVKELRAYGKLDDFRPQGFAFALFFENFGLAEAAAVKALLHDDAVEAEFGGHAGDGGSVVAGGRGDRALVAEALRLIAGKRCAAGLEAARGVLRFVFDKDARAHALRRNFAGKLCEVVHIDDRGVPHVHTVQNFLDFFETVGH